MMTPEIIKIPNDASDYLSSNAIHWGDAEALARNSVFAGQEVVVTITGVQISKIKSLLTFLECILENIISGRIILKFKFGTFKCDIVKLLLVISLMLNSSSSQDRLKMLPSLDSPSLIIFACIPNWPCCLNVIHAFPSSSLNKKLLIRFYTLWLI